MPLQHLRASVANKRPAPSGMSDGQLAINTNDASPGLFIKNAGGTLVKIGPVHVGTAAPNVTPASGGTSGNTTGELWLDSTGGDYALKTWDGSAWQTTVVTSGMIKDGTIGNADINDSAAIALSKLATGALPTGITVSSGNIVDGTIVDADINASAVIAGTKISPDFGSQNITTSGNITIGDKIIHDGDTNTAIRFPAADTIAFETDGSERARIDSSGRLLVGTSSARSVGQVTQPIQSETASGSAGIACVRNSDDINGSYVVLAKSRGTVLGSNTIVQDNDQLGAIVFSAADGTDMNSSGAYIQAFVDGAPGTDDMPCRLVFSTTAGGNAAPTERMRIDRNGKLLIGSSTRVDNLRDSQTTVDRNASVQIQGTSGPGASQAQISWHSATTGFYAPQFWLAKSNASDDTIGTNTIVTNGTQLGAINFAGNDGSTFLNAANITAEVDGTPGANDMPGRLVFSTTSDGSASPTERMRIDSDGDVLIANSAGVDITSSSSNGHRFGDTGAAFHARNSSTTLFIGRNTNDGSLVAFYQDGTIEGTISVAGSTVSYNPFLGSHWGRLADGSKPDILPGTILDTVNQLIEWKQAKFTVDEEEKIAAYNGPAEVGDTVAIDYEGTSYSAIVQNEEEDPEELNKHVCVKVNDTASSKAVFGVFLGWDHDIPENMVSTWNDLYCAAVGNYFVRIADGETLEIGSLIEADGNGCGIVQDDDIIRSKTVAKITSTIPQKVYDDGSFLVTCVLCCG